MEDTERRRQPTCYSSECQVPALALQVELLTAKVDLISEEIKSITPIIESIKDIHTGIRGLIIVGKFVGWTIPFSVGLYHADDWFKHNVTIK